MRTTSSIKNPSLNVFLCPLLPGFDSANVGPVRYCLALTQVGPAHYFLQVHLGLLDQPLLLRPEGVSHQRDELTQVAGGGVEEEGGRGEGGKAIDTR